MHIVLDLIMVFCSGIFFMVGIYAWRKKEPMWFFSGSEEEIKAEHFHDIEEYNHKNGMMWGIYAISSVIPYLFYRFHLISIQGFAFSTIIIYSIGIVIMIIYWTHLHKKYTR